MPTTSVATSRRFMDADEYSGRMCTVETYKNVPPEKISNKATQVPLTVPDIDSKKYVSSAASGATQENHSTVCRTAHGTITHTTNR